MSGAASEPGLRLLKSRFPFTLQPDYSERFVNGKQPRARRSAHCLGMLIANNRCRSVALPMTSHKIQTCVHVALF